MFFTVLVVLTTKNFLFYVCFIFEQTNFCFCFSISWTRTAMTNSGERPKLEILKLPTFSATICYKFLMFYDLYNASIANFYPPVNNPD
jgi:hypothetical protein